jgi:hypothetical protein
MLQDAVQDHQKGDVLSDSSKIQSEPARSSDTRVTASRKKSAPNCRRDTQQCGDGQRHHRPRGEMKTARREGTREEKQNSHGLAW